MVVRGRFDVTAFIESWPEEGAPADLFQIAGDLPEERRLGLAALMLISTRREYWTALAFIAGYADAREQSVHAVVEELAPGGEPTDSALEEFDAWVGRSADIDEVVRRELIPAAQVITSVFRVEALAAAADNGER